MIGRRYLMWGLAALLLAGCSANRELTATKAELEKARSAAIKVAQSYANYKKEAAEETAKLKQQLAATTEELNTSKQTGAKAVSDLEEIRSERARIAAELETVRGELTRVQAEQSGEKERLIQRHADLQAELETLRSQHRNALLDLEGTKEKLTAREQAPVVVSSTLVVPAEVTEKVHRLEAELAQAQAARIQAEARSEAMARRVESARQREEAPPKPRREPIRIAIGEGLLFDSGEARLNSAGCEVIKQSAEEVKRQPDMLVRVEGHTDDKPLSSRLRARYRSNWDLSTDRAFSVVHCLVSGLGVPADRVSAVGYGETRPVASNETEEGRRKNRRVEIVLYPSEGSREARQATLGAGSR